MKTSLPRIITSLVVAVLFLVFALIVSFKSYASQPAPCSKPPTDSIFIRKNFSRKNYKVSLYPDADQKVLFFSVKGENGRVYQLYVFDIDGKLITQREVRNKQTTFVSDIAKGLYLYDVFCDDERISNGQIAIR